MFRFGTEQYWHGALYHHGQPGRRYDELKTIGSELKRAGEQFLGSENRNQVAMILSYDARWGADADHLETLDDLPALLNDFHAREVLHVTFGSAIGKFGVELKSALIKYEDAYYEGLRTHFEKHLSLLKD